MSCALLAPRRGRGTRRFSRRPGSKLRPLKVTQQIGNEPPGLRGPFVIRLRGRIPHPAGYPETPRTLADHLKKARLDRGFPQRDAARAIGCSPLTFLHWEKGRVAPDVRFWAAILTFWATPLDGARGLWWAD